MTEGAALQFSNNEQDPNLWPTVSVIVPVRNEERFVDQAIQGILAQNYPKESLEILVVDGESTDQTRERVQAWSGKDPAVRLLSNPRRIVPTAFNAALRLAKGEVIVRMDGHCEYAEDYIRQLIRLRASTGADNAGGVVEPVGKTWTERAVCAAYHSRVGLGGAALRGHAGVSVTQEVDAVHGGCWLKRRLEEVGGMDEEMVRNQDDELSFRLRKSGGRIVQNTGIRVRYHVRGSFRQLGMQFAQYGYWKVRVIQKHPQQASLRHFVPGGFVALVLVAALLGLVWPIGLGVAAFLLLSYLAATAIASALQLFGGQFRLWPGVVLALACMHFGYGAGFLMGRLRSWFGRLPGDQMFERVTR